MGENTTMNCPQCGSRLPSHALQTKLLQCTYCDSTLLIEANRASKHDLRSRVNKRQSLLAQGGMFRWRDQMFTPQGFIQYEHADGYLTDWWVTREETDAQTIKQPMAFWLTENDENFFLTQTHTCTLETDVAWTTLQPNRELMLLNQHWLVTQKQALRYNGMSGSLPVTSIPPNRHIIYLAQANATTLLLDCTDSGEVSTCRQGSWLDPFEIERIQ